MAIVRVPLYLTTGGDGAFQTEGSCNSTLSCQDFIVRMSHHSPENGDQLKDARWEIDFLRIYSNGCVYDKKHRSHALALAPMALGWAAVLGAIGSLVFLL